MDKIKTTLPVLAPRFYRAQIQQGHNQHCFFSRVSSYSTLLATGSDDKTVKLWVLSITSKMEEANGGRMSRRKHNSRRRKHKRSNRNEKNSRKKRGILRRSIMKIY